MNNIFDALEVCLHEIENGADVETVLARYPKLADELRPILETSMKASSMPIPEPSPEAVRRGRARVMQRAAELRESRVAPRKRVIPAFQRLALSFSLAALLLLSSTGLLSASASALPGENLYPVKRTWEGLRLLLIFDQQARTLLEDQFEYERLHEVNELLTEGRDETIQFAGVFMQINGVTYVSGVPVILPAKMQLPANGAPVVLTGLTNAQGVVEISSLELLPDGSVVPVGNPVDMELDSNSNSDDSDNSGNSNSSDNNTATPEDDHQNYAMEGTLQAISSTTMVIDGIAAYPDNARIEGELCVGARVEVEGYFAADGRFIVTKVDAKGSCSINDNSDENSNGSSDSNDDSGGGNDNNSGQDSNDNSDDNSGKDSNDNSADNSGSGGGDNSGGGGSDD